MKTEVLWALMLSVFNLLQCNGPRESLKKGTPLVYVLSCVQYLGAYHHEYVVWSYRHSTTEPGLPNIAIWHIFRLHKYIFPNTLISFWFWQSWKKQEDSPKLLSLYLFKKMTHILTMWLFLCNSLAWNYLELPGEGPPLLLCGTGALIQLKLSEKGVSWVRSPTWMNMTIDTDTLNQDLYFNFQQIGTKHKLKT